MADNTQGPRPLRPRDLRHPLPAAHGRSERTSAGRVYRMPRHPGSGKHFLATEAGWRLVSAAFSIGAFTGATYVLVWVEVTHR